MTRIEARSGKLFAAVCLLIIMVYFGSIMGRFLTAHIVVRKLGIKNTLTTAILFDVPELNRLPNEMTDSNRKVGIDWQKLYPFPFAANAAGAEKNSLLDKYQSKVKAGEKKVDDWTGKHLMGRTKLTALAA